MGRTRNFYHQGWYMGWRQILTYNEENGMISLWANELRKSISALSVKP